MAFPSLDEVRSYWQDDEGAFLDVYVDSEDEHGWQLAVDAVRALGWLSDYSEDGEPVSMPRDVGEILARARGADASRLWRLRPVDGVGIHAHFYEDGVGIDVDPRELASQLHLDLVCEFMRAIGQALRQPVGLGMEGGDPPVMMAYDPATDTVSVGVL